MATRAENNELRVYMNWMMKETLTCELIFVMMYIHDYESMINIILIGLCVRYNCTVRSVFV